MWKHFVRHGKRVAIIVCPRLTDGARQFCPICDKVRELRSSGNPDDREAGFKMKAQLRAFCNVIDRDAADKGPQIWDMTKTVYKDGHVSIGRKRAFYLSEALAGQQVGLREVKERYWLVSFMDKKLGYLDERIRKVVKS